MNLWHRTLSISSACLIFMLIRNELIEPSMSTLSESVLLMTTGVRRTSFVTLGEVEETEIRRNSSPPVHRQLPLLCALSRSSNEHALSLDLWFVVPFHDLRRKVLET